MLPKNLEAHRQRIEKIAKDLGLDFFPTIFELVTYDQINQIAAYGGFPVRYPHWKFGMEYEHLSKSYEYGLSKIYEMVINNDPCYAYLMEGNSELDQKLVMAHVFGHCDFFKNNVWFKDTDRKMMNTMGNHATRVRRYIDKYGVDVVETFMDHVLSLENLIDRYNPSQNMGPAFRTVVENEPMIIKSPRGYMDRYLNPKDPNQEPRIEKEEFVPQKDILYFLMNSAPLTDWQADIVSIIRKEAYYYSPQGMTKTLNEGWASYWHSKILTEHVLTDSEVFEFADKHAGVMTMAPNGYNPYKIGIELLRDIEERWNRGQFGREWDECDDISERKHWDKKLGLGKEKIFEVRKLLSDVAFIDQYLTKDFCKKHGFFVYKLDKRTGRYVVDDTDFEAIKKMLLFKMTNFGQPIISITNPNFENKGQLLLEHLHEGMDLQPDFMQETLKSLYALWTRPVNLITKMDNQGFIYSYDGSEITSKKL